VSTDVSLWRSPPAACCRQHPRAGLGQRGDPGDRKGRRGRTGAVGSALLGGLRRSYRGPGRAQDLCVTRKQAPPPAPPSVRCRPMRSSAKKPCSACTCWPSEQSVGRWSGIVRSHGPGLDTEAFKVRVVGEQFVGCGGGSHEPFHLTWLIRDLDGKAYSPGTRQNQSLRRIRCARSGRNAWGSFTFLPFRVSRKPKLITVLITYEVIDAVRLSS
jgi:hypothetical protein